ncbi:MAG: DUF2207 domain-containing protein [Saprospiraceae bacterium]|nr:DUF2207 domain-containing protein [Saprospiraceae bacterium]
MRTKILNLIFLLGFPFLLIGQKERIYNFDVTLDIDTSSVLTVTENIKVYVNRENIQRGIYRALPLFRKDKNNNNIPIAYEVISVTRDGRREAFHTQETRDKFKIYVGSESVLLDPGQYQYSLTYKTYGQIGYFEKYDEIYWNVTGTEWEFPIDEASAEVILPSGAEVLQNACYTGLYGMKSSDCQYTDSPRPRFTANGLHNNEGLTIALGFTKGIVHEPPPPGFFKKNILWFLSFGGMLLMMIYYYFTWSKYGRDPEKPAVYPVFEAPDGLSPVGVGCLDADRIRYDLVGASIINLAVKGFVHIEDIKTGLIFKTHAYKITKLKDAESQLPPEEADILQRVFGNKKEVLIDGEYDSTISSAKLSYNSSIQVQYQKLINTGRNYTFLIPPVLFSIISIIFMLNNTGAEVQSTDMDLARYLPFGMFGLFLIVSLLPLLSRLFKINKTGLIAFLIMLVFLVFIAATADFQIGTYLIFGFILFVIVSLISYKYLINRPTEEKLRLQSLVEGFKMYLSAAENEQIKMFNPPKMTPEIFEKYLPYAIALKVDKIWGEKFQSYLQTAGLPPYQGTWYSGYSSFNSDFPGTLNRSMHQTVASTSTKPSDSGGGSWSGGSGGGGFSGGGGGGGGGGGW